MYRNCNNEYQRDQRVSEQLLYIVCRGAGFSWLREYFGAMWVFLFFVSGFA